MAVTESCGADACSLVAAGVTYVEIVLNLKNEVRLCRCECIAAGKIVLRTVATLCASAAEVFECEVETVYVANALPGITTRVRRKHDPARRAAAGGAHRQRVWSLLCALRAQLQPADQQSRR